MSDPVLRRRGRGRLRGRVVLTPDRDTPEMSDLQELPVRFVPAQEAGTLPPLHRDPFDRMLVAQARCVA